MEHAITSRIPQCQCACMKRVMDGVSTFKCQLPGHDISRLMDCRADKFLILFPDFLSANDKSL